MFETQETDREAVVGCYLWFLAWSQRMLFSEYMEIKYTCIYLTFCDMIIPDLQKK